MNPYVSEIKLSLKQCPIDARNMEGLRRVYRTIYGSLIHMGAYEDLTQVREAYEAVKKEMAG